MQIDENTPVYIVSSDGKTTMSFGGFLNAIAGGTRLQDISVFTDVQEAESAERARLRRSSVKYFTNDEILRAESMVLLDDEGGVIHKIEFCPTD